jgi:hypothetical protein
VLDEVKECWMRCGGGCVGVWACGRVGVLLGLGVLADAWLGQASVQSWRVASRTQLLHIVCHAIYMTGG